MRNLRKGGKLTVSTLHEGVRLYLGWLNGYPPLEPCLNDCHAETVRVFYHCQSIAAEIGDDQHLVDMGDDMRRRLIEELGGILDA